MLVCLKGFEAVFCLGVSLDQLWSSREVLWGGLSMWRELCSFVCINFLPLYLTRLWMSFCCMCRLD